MHTAILAHNPEQLQGKVDERREKTRNYFIFLHIPLEIQLVFFLHRQFQNYFGICSQKGKTGKTLHATIANT